MPDKDQIRKEFNEFLDSASDETIKDFLRFMKERQEKRSMGRDHFNDRLN